LLHTIRNKGFDVDDSLLCAEYDLYDGDLVSVGRGEVLFPHVGSR